MTTIGCIFVLRDATSLCVYVRVYHSFLLVTFVVAQFAQPNLGLIQCFVVVGSTSGMLSKARGGKTCAQ